MSSQNLPTLDWNSCDSGEWNGLLATAGRSSLEQSWAYGTAVTQFYGHATDRAIIRRDGETLAMVQLFRKQVARMATVARIVRGPVWLAPGADADTQMAVYRAIRGSFSIGRRELLFWIPELIEEQQSAMLMRAAGTRQMVTGLSSAWLDLSPDKGVLRSHLATNWRHALGRAEKQDTRIRVSGNSRDLPGHMAIYDAFRRRKRFVGPPGGFVTAIGEAGRHTKDAMILSAVAGDDIVAGIVLIRHGTCATYYVSWSTDEGRRRGAHNLLLWRGIGDLKKAGVAWLDLGGLNTDSAAGIARFKLGLQPETFTLAGTFL